MKTVQELVGTFYANLWNAWDDASVDVVLAPDFAFRGTLGTETHGRDGWREYRDTVRAGSADWHNEIVTLIVEGNSAAVRVRFTGTHTGTLAGFAATGRRISYDGAAFFTAEHGMLTSAWVLGDTATLRAQLGAT
jgi:predicted ester cyclase